MRISRLWSMQRTRRGMKVYMDIITNHTADVIQYKECPTGGCAIAAAPIIPIQRRASHGGPKSTPVLMGIQVQTAENFAKLTDP
jgi:hypothetical protein